MKRVHQAFARLFLCLLPFAASVLSTVSTRSDAQDIASDSGVVLRLVEDLANQETSKRWQAAKELGKMGPAAKPALPALLKALQDTDSSVRQYAVVAIGRIGDGSKEVVEKLILSIGDDDAGIRIAAANSIRMLVSDPAVLIPLAVDILDKEDPIFASRMVETIVLRGEKAVPFLIAALKNQRAAYWACLAIEELGVTASETVPALAELLTITQEDELKIQAMLALSKMGPHAASAKEPILLSLNSGSSDSVSTAAAFAAGSLSIIEATPRLEETKNSKEPLLKMVSLWALAKLHPEDGARTQVAVDHLVQNLGSADAHIRLAAAKGLQSLPLDSEVVAPKLVHLLDDSDPVVAYNLAETFASLGEPVAERAGNALSNEKLRSLAVQVLERLGPKAKLALPKIVNALAEAEGEYRHQLQSVVAKIGPDAGAATGELIRSLDDASSDIRISALLSLASIGHSASAANTKTLAVMESAKDPFERLLAAWALAKIAGSDEKAVAKVVPVLIEGLSFPDGRVQVEAATALGDLGSAANAAASKLDALAANQDAPTELRDAARAAAAAVR